MKRLSFLWIIPLVVLIIASYSSTLFAKIKIIEEKNEEKIEVAVIRQVETGREFKLMVGDVIVIFLKNKKIITIIRSSEKEFFMEHPKGCSCITCSEMRRNFHPEIPFEPKEGHGLVIFSLSDNYDDKSRIVLRCASPKESLFKIVVRD